MTRDLGLNGHVSEPVEDEHALVGAYAVGSEGGSGEGADPVLRSSAGTWSVTA